MTTATRQVVFLFVFFVAFPSMAEEFTGKVVSITDGDTIKVLVGQNQIKVRLAEIDTPEKSQPYGKRAKQALSRLIFKKNVTVDSSGKDRYGRVISKV